MKVREITKVVVDRLEYIADDGKVFTNKESCEQYEKSDFFEVKKKLKMLCETNCDEFFGDESGYDSTVQIFDIKTEEDLDNLKTYIRSYAKAHGADDNAIKEMFTSVDGINRKDYVLDNLTFGHEVIICWSYNEDWCWAYRDGSMNGYIDYIKEKMMNCLKNNV